MREKLYQDFFENTVVYFTQPNFKLVKLSDPSKVRRSGPEMFCRKGVLKNFATFTRKHLCHSLFLNKVVALRPATLLY